MLRLLLYLLLFFLIYRIIRNFIKGFTQNDNKTKVYGQKKKLTKYDDIEEANYTEIKDDKEKNR
ncbi:MULTISPECIES: hypothetical protein [Ignavibacterium]|jgi:ABC-type sugar transport system permease subunit|uniref:hypothetical protein n=1 Tax=Ignavibacterium TaxID=795750 RepID=UPI0025BF1A8B|nr:MULTISPECIES: hypothetical protein [Ignavibacterium]MBI5661216.1 hypothetical protein [Ignavibacterium album]